MDVTVVLCTFNRCHSLARTLDSVAVSKLPDSVEWEVLVVDNNSRDQTREVVEEYCRRYPGRFRYVFEAQPGKSYALNRGIQEAKGDVLAFMDDDVTVEPTWLQNLTRPLQGAQWAGVGGRILPEWLCPIPAWVPLEERHVLGLFALFDRGLEAGALREAPFGTNMAFRRTMFEKYNGFRSDLGPRPGSEIRGEDTEFGRRLLQAGEQLWYEPSAIVYHPVPPSRLQKKYFLAWWFDKARSDFFEFGIPKETRRLIAGVPLYMFRRLGIWTLRWLVAVEPSQRFSCKLKVWGLAGGILESYRQSRGEARGRLYSNCPIIKPRA